MRKLDWYSQPTGMGAFTSEGTEKLLGTPGVENLELLVRESAQNSWDAALDQTVPIFGIDYRILASEQRDLLKEEVFNEGREYTLLPMSWMKDTIDVLEIWDRGTTGLNGPVRADLTVPEDVPTNFIDLIYMIGSSNKDQDAGGNYGFGKSSAYKFSEAKTILYWTVCRNDLGVLEHRFIASGVSNEFDIDGRSYVGRHWWGNRVEDSTTGETRLEPLIGAAAQELGEALFSRKFASEETGTSILIIDPDEFAIIGNPYDEEPSTELQPISDRKLMNAVNKRLTDVVMKHLWPKLVANNDQRRMRVFVNSSEITEDIGRAYPYIGSYKACLDAVRNLHDQTHESSLPRNVDVFEIVVGRAYETIGHLALTTSINLNTNSAEPTGEILDTDIPKNAVALMRDGAELIVKYVSGIQEHPKEQLYWTGVFKPCPEFDPDFAAAEPSSHDDWIVGSLQGISKTRVKVSLSRVEEKVRSYLGAKDPVALPAGAGSVLELARELGSLIAVIDGNMGGTSGSSNGAPGNGTTGTRAPKTTSNGTGRKRDILVSEINLEETSKQRNMHRVEVKFIGDWSRDEKFSVNPKVRIEGNAKSASVEDNFEFSWPEEVREDQSSPQNGAKKVLVMTKVVDSISFDVYSPGHVSFDVHVEPK